jgi:hypothetical protein
MKSLPALPAILWVLLLCLEPSRAETNSVPSNGAATEALDLFWGAAPSIVTCSVKGDGRVLTYEFTSAAKKNKVKIVPAKEAWEKFWKAMDEVQLWKWQKRYDNVHIMDGLVWSLDVRRGEQKVRSGGHNGYPTLERLTKPAQEPSPIFRKYQQAVEELMGRKLWQP